MNNIFLKSPEMVIRWRGDPETQLLLVVQELLRELEIMHQRLGEMAGALDDTEDHDWFGTFY